MIMEGALTFYKEQQAQASRPESQERLSPGLHMSTRLSPTFGKKGARYVSFGMTDGKKAGSNFRAQRLIKAKGLP